MRLLFVIGLMLGLSSCQWFKPKPVAPITKVPVVNACLSKRPILPTMRFDKLPQAKTEAESAEHVRILWLDRQSLLSHSIEWDVAASGCEVISK